MSYTLVTKYPVEIPAQGGGTTGDTTSVGIYTTLTGSRSGTKVEKYRELIQKGLPASSEYSLDAYKVQLGPPLQDILSLGREGSQGVFMTSTFTGFPGAAWSDGTLAHLPVGSDLARSVALSKLYKKLESDRSELNSYAVLAEFTDVLRQFGRPFGAIVDAFMRHENRLIFERRRLVGSKTWRDEQFARIAADTWLEVSFGLLPLFSDAVSVAEAFGRFEYELAESPRLRERMRTRAFDVTRQRTGEMDSMSQPFSYIGYAVVKETQTIAKCQYTVGLQGDVRAAFGSNERLLQLLGLEPRNLPLAAWEAVPWSWLVDYFTNVQQILQAGATITSRVKWIVLSQTIQTAATYRAKVSRLGTGSYFDLGFKTNKKAANRVGFSSPQAEWDQALKGKYPPLDPGDFRLIRTTFNRTLPVSLGVPPLYFKTPLGDLKKVANLGALVASRWSTHKTWLS